MIIQIENENCPLYFENTTIEIDFGEDEVSFRNLLWYSAAGPLNVTYRLLKRNGKWQVRNFRTGDRGGEEDEDEE